MKPTGIIKRDGTQVPFDSARIVDALGRALHAVGVDEPEISDELARVVEEHLERTAARPALDLEEVQDAVVHVLQESGYYEAAIAYARYRDARERRRREMRLRGESAAAPNLAVVDLEGRRRPWRRDWLTLLLIELYVLSDKIAGDVLTTIEEGLAATDLTELRAPLLLSLVDAALVRLGMQSLASERAPLRIDRHTARSALAHAQDGHDALVSAGRQLLRQMSLSEGYPPEVALLFCRGRLWIDGLDDPRRGTQFTATVDSHANPWQVVANAFALATETVKHWRRVRLVLPPTILGHLERGAHALAQPISALSELTSVYLYCDGRTPLLGDWPFTGRRVSLATYNDDFLLQRQLQDMRLHLLSGPHLLRGGYRAPVAVELALNAQGLDGEFAQLDALAAALVAGAGVRLAQLGAQGAGAEVRFAIYGLTLHSLSNDYLERQVMQEGSRCGLILVRSANLPEDACVHLGRLLE